MSFDEAKLRQLDAASSHRVYGHELDGGEGSAKSRDVARRRWRLINPCFCVHDSPESPCPCMEDDPRWWLPIDAILNEGNTGRKDHSGNELSFFDVRLDSSILVESVQPLRVSALKRLGTSASPEGVRQLMSSGSGTTDVAYGPIREWLEEPAPDWAQDIMDVIGDMLRGPRRRSTGSRPPKTGWTSRKEREGRSRRPESSTIGPAMEQGDEAPLERVFV